MSGLDPGVELADTKTLLAHAVKLLRLHVERAEFAFDPDCEWDKGQPCYSCRTFAFLRDNFPVTP